MLRRPLESAQYLAVRYPERLAEAGAVSSIGSKGDSYDNAMAEAFNSLFKAELVCNRGPWKNIDDLEIAVAEADGQSEVAPPVQPQPASRTAAGRCGTVADVTGMVCLQGGGEFSRGCRPMDSLLLDRADGPIVVTALAGAVGSDYRTASQHGVRHFRAMGAADVVAAPDVRQDRDAALATLRTARLLVLPGGSPSRLLEALTKTGVDDLLRDLLASGGTVIGSSAGAMVLCEWTVLPDRRGLGALAVAKGLCIVPGMLVVPHWTGDRDEWLRAVPQGVQVLGLPEESGVLVEGGILTAVGRTATRLVSVGTDLAPDDSWHRPDRRDVTKQPGKSV